MNDLVRAGCWSPEIHITRGEAMIRLGHHIRLTPREVARFTELTGFAPENVKTIDDLDAYVAQCKHYYWGTSDDTRFLHWLIDRECARYLGNF